MKKPNPNSLKAEDVAHMLKVSLSIVERIVKEQHLIPAHPGHSFFTHRFTEAQVLAFAKEHGTGPALYKPTHFVGYTPPIIDWDTAGRRAPDYEYLLDRSDFQDLKFFFPLDELTPPLAESIRELRPARRFAVEGRMRGLSNRELARLVDRKDGTLQQAFREAVGDIDYSRPAARLRLVLRRFKRLYRCAYAFNLHDAPCVHCGRIRYQHDREVHALRQLACRARSGQSDRDNLRETILCPARTPPPAIGLSIFDLAHPDQFEALDLPFKESGLDRRIVSALERDGYTHLGHAYHRLDGHIESHLSDQADKGRVAKNALKRVMELYVSLGLAEEGEYPTWRERMLAERKHESAERKASRRAPALTVNRSDEDDEDERGLLDWDISDIDLSVRAYNTLSHAGIRTLRDIVTRTEQDLRRTKNFGDKVIAEIKLMLDSMGLGLGMYLDAEGRPLPITASLTNLIPPHRPDDDGDGDVDDDWVM